MKPLEKFGEFIVKNLRDKALIQHALLQQGKLKGHAIQQLQSALLELSAEQRELVAQIVRDAIDTALHDVLFAFQDAHDRNLGIEVFCDGINVAEASKMLNGEPLGDSGWVKRFSSFP